MQNINLLIVASSDMDGTNDNYNLPGDVLNLEYPCSNYNGKSIKENEITTSNSPRCKKCHYTQVEHKYGYPLFPLHPVKLIAGEMADTSMPVYEKSKYSDFWKNKYGIVERIKYIFGADITINYHTITPNYVNNLDYLPILEKINNIIANKLEITGSITYTYPYHFSCLLDEIYTQKDYNETKYDCIFVVSGGFGCLYTHENFNLMTKLLGEKANIAVIGHLWDTPILEYPEYDGKYKFMNPINSCLKDNYIYYYDKNDVKECIRDYTNILLHNDNFNEAYEMLFRV